MTEEVSITWYPGAQNKISKEIPDKIIYEVARMTLDLVIPTIPERTGKMRQSTLAGGVRGGNGTYWIGSYTNYAKYPYVMDNERTHWTTPGTNSRWFSEYFKKHGQAIFSMVVEENKLK